jgi:hypothetical protein
MKKIIILITLMYSFSSLAFFGIFKREINPLELKTFEERMEYLMNEDPDFRAWVKEQEARKKEIIAHNERVLAVLEKEWEDRKNYSEEEYEARKLRIKMQKEQQLGLEQRELERKLLSEWIVVNDKFVNKEEERKRIEREKKEAEGMENIRKFQKENGLPITKPGEQLNISYE